MAIPAVPTRLQQQTRAIPSTKRWPRRFARVASCSAMRCDSTMLASAGNECVLHPVGPVILHGGDDTGDAQYFHASGAVCNLPMLAQAAGSSGFMNAAPDGDGILRRAPLLIELDGRIYPSLALAATMAATGSRDLALRISNVNTASLIVDNHAVPVDGRANALLRYRGKKQTFPYVSAADVMSGRVPAGNAAGQDRVRRHDGPGNARGRGDAARHVVCRRRSPGDRRGQSAAAGLHQPIAIRDGLEGLVVLVLGIAVTCARGEYGHAVGSARQRHQHRGAVVFRRVGAVDDTAYSCRRCCPRSA